MQRSSLKYMMLLVLVMSLLIVPRVYADEPEEGHLAPLSPEFLRWRDEQEAQTGTSTIKSDGTTYTDHQTGGYIPIPVDLSHLALDLPREEADDSPVPTVKDSSLPATFDLRTMNKVTSVKNQNPYGSCWAFAAIGAMESNYKMQGGIIEYDLSEMHLAWYTFRNSDKSRAFKNLNSATFSTVMNQGGNSFYPTAMFSRLDGPAREDEVPYGTQPTQPGPQYYYTQNLRLREVYHLSMSGALDINSSEEQRNIVKRRIMQNGSVAVNYNNSDSLYNKTSAGTSYYTTAKTVNHAVQIIGWDDNFSSSNFKTKPKSNGAWLIKNSWGNQWYTPNGYMGDDGCFWMSYESYLTDGTAFIVEQTDARMNVYEYDALGWCSTWGYSGSEIHAANVFKSERGETLTEVGFYTAYNNMGYEVSVYTGFSSMPSSSPIAGSRVSLTSGTIGFAGYHTVALNTPVSLTDGQYFSVVVKFTGAGMTPVERVVSGFSNNATIEDGSFFSPNGSNWVTGKLQKQNACIKAFTIAGTVSGVAPKIWDGYPPDGRIGEAYSAQLSASGSAPITWTASQLPAGLTLNPTTGIISGTPTTECNMTFKITASNAYGSDSKNFTMNIWSAPKILNESFDAYAGYAFSGQLKLDQTAPATWSVSSSTESRLPAGLSLKTKTGEITGKPSKPGTYNVTFKATTVSAGSAEKVVQFTIYDKPIKPAVKNASLPAGYIGVEYSQELVVTGTTPISVDIEGLPNGFTVTPNGYITGTPAVAGKHSIKVTAQNLATELDGKPVTKTLKLEFKMKPPTFEDVTSLPDGKVDEAYSGYTFNLVSTDGPVTWKASGLPTGLTLTNGMISGTPKKAGSFKVTVTATNAGGKASLKVPMTVYLAPTISTATLPAGTTGKKYSAKVTAKGTLPLSWDVSGLPSTLTYSASGANLTITGTPLEVTSYDVTITVSNVAGSASITPTLTVKGVAPKLTATLAVGKIDVAYTGSKIASTGTMPVTIAYSISDVDKAKFGINDLSDLGLTFTNDSSMGTAAITGTPATSIKALPITLTATNNSGSASKVVKLTLAGVKPAFTSPTAATINITAGHGEAVSMDFTVTGTKTITFTSNNSDYTITKTGDYTATLSGTAPSTDGKTTITITASNNDGKATRKLVVNVMSAPTITTTSLADATLKKSYTSKLEATGSKTIKWTLTDGSLPSGVKLTNGKLTGKPTVSGTFKFSVTAKNDIGSDTKDFTLTVNDPNAVTSTPELEPESIPETQAVTPEPEPDPEPDIVLGLEREASSLSAGQASMLTDEGYVTAAILPELTVNVSGLYDFEVDLNEDAVTGAKLYWFAFPKGADTTDEDYAEFYDESGAEIDSVPEGHKVTVSVWLNEGITYEPVIAVRNE